jgi:hypothetical protein
MELSPSWESSRSWASQEIPRILWNPKVHYLLYRRPLSVPVPSQMNPVHASRSHFLEIHFNIILTSRSQSSKWSFPLKSPHLMAVIHISTMSFRKLAGFNSQTTGQVLKLLIHEGYATGRQPTFVFFCLLHSALATWPTQELVMWKLN